MSKEPNFAVTPYDLEQSLLRPQHDPLCGEIMSRLLHKKTAKKQADGNTASNISTDNNYQNLDYDTWNMMLAKRFSMMFKNYRKFSIKFLNKDPVVVIQSNINQNEEQPHSQINEEEHKIIEQINMEQILNQGIQKDDQKSEQAQQNQSDQDQQINSQEEVKQQVFAPRERITRSRAAAANKPAQDPKANQKDKKQKKEEEVKNEVKEEPEPQIVIEQQWSSDIAEHLLKQHNEQNITVRFSHEDFTGLGNQQQLKTEQLQIIKLFNEDLEGKDPFYIEGQDWQANQKDESNYWSNFVDVDALEDFEDYNPYAGQFGLNKQEVLFKKFHEIPTKNRIDILYFLCQNKLDSEQPDFMQEVLVLQQTKPQRIEQDPSQPIKMSEELKQMLEPINFGLLKPLGQINQDILSVEERQDFVLPQPGKYFYFPFFSDTRIYRQSLDNQEFVLYLEEYDQIQLLINTLRQLEDREDCFNLLEKLQSYADFLKKYADEMKWKEASKVRKLKSQIRSRKLQDISRKKLQFEGRQSQIQTDYLHHAQGNVMTRKQVDTLKSKMTKGPGIQIEEKKKEKTAGPSAITRHQEMQKEKYEKEKLDRQKRLEKRMKLKERIAFGQLGKRKRRGANSEDEDDYGDEYDEENEGEAGQSGSKRQKTNEEVKDDEEQDDQSSPEYDILLNGQLLMIYQREQFDVIRGDIINETMVIKGTWKLSIEEQSEEFIYKKIGPPSQESLLTSLFCEDPSEKITPGQLPQEMPELHREILNKFFGCQGLYEGYFKYNDEDVTEKFSFIIRKPRQKSKKQLCYDLCGYGENSIGPFTMEGFIQLISLEKIQEKDGVKQFKKMKLAKFNIQRNYKQKFLEEMVEEIQLERQQMGGMQSNIFVDKSKTHIKIQNIQLSNDSQQHQNSQQEHMYSQASVQSFQQHSQMQQLPKLSSLNQSPMIDMNAIQEYAKTLFNTQTLPQMQTNLDFMMHQGLINQQHNQNLASLPQNLLGQQNAGLNQLLANQIKQVQIPNVQSALNYGLAQTQAELQRLAAQQQAVSSQLIDQSMQFKQSLPHLNVVGDFQQPFAAQLPSLMNQQELITQLMRGPMIQPAQPQDQIQSNFGISQLLGNLANKNLNNFGVNNQQQ